MVIPLLANQDLTPMLWQHGFPDFLTLMSPIICLLREILFFCCWNLSTIVVFWSVDCYRFICCRAVHTFTSLKIYYFCPACPIRQALAINFSFLAVVNEVTKVHVDCKGAGKGELSASVIGQGTNTLYPVSVKDTSNLTYEIAYSVPNTGEYEFAIKYDDIHIKGSPFIVTGYTRTHPEEIGMVFHVYYMSSITHMTCFIRRCHAEFNLHCNCVIFTWCSRDHLKYIIAPISKK